ncbi:MAG: glycoside hydrolase family 99-like domain-containing protein, partial [Bdellovibrio sp.]|nr:glycoside hydrolase family 99-like domain-containing protein [Bdellovibrio sp.]
MNIKKIARRIRKTIFRSSINNSKLYEKEFIKHSNSSSGLGSSFVKYKAHNLTSQEVSRVKHIALYLTQFHTNKENDQWWGKNFTEWVNATKATPQYEGHHQPHLPHDVGFYNLLEKSTWSQQIDLAKNYGIYGFCFYYYWFNGKRLLDGPLNLFLKDKELDFPFCLFWANDSWTRTWHGFSDNKGSEREVLMEQSHNDLDDELFITHLLDHYFSDKRYIRVNDKPLLIVYHTYLFKNISKTTEKWRSIAKRRGTDLFLMYVLMPGQEDAPLIDGFDAAMQFS